MINEMNDTCPGCAQHCDLTAPHCGVGREFALTGNLPERPHGHHGRQQGDMDDAQNAQLVEGPRRFPGHEDMTSPEARHGGA